MQALPCKAEPLRVRSVKGGLAPVRSEDETREAWMQRLAEAVGTDDTEIARLTIRSLAAGLGHRDDVTLNALLAQVQEMSPQNAIERCLLIQMMLTSHKAMSAMAESGGTLMPEESAAQSALSIRLMRLYLQQCETLRRLRSCGSQTITINHVVADKAVIGDVYQSGGGI